MGFFDSFLQGFNGIKEDRDNREIVEMYHDMNENDNDYRKKAFENSESNYGWYTCARCGKKFRKKDMDVDHIVPKSCGGDNSRYNLQILCAHCNRSKGANMQDTARDLERRRKEIKKQDADDVKFLKNSTKKGR